MKSNNPIVILDGYTLNPGDLSWSPITNLADTTIYDHSQVDDILSRSKQASILVVNKTPIDATTLSQLSHLKCICVSATGFNNVDAKAAKGLGIPVCNVVGYGSYSVAQHVFACILKFTNEVALHQESVQRGDWAQCRDFSYSITPIQALNGKTLGIYGLGRIGQQVARIGAAFNMTILATHKHPERDASPGITFVDLPTLFKESDFITLHAPLSEHNFQIVNDSLLDLMKPTAYLINTGRGGLIHESALRTALIKDKLAGAALDVLSQEPPVLNHPLMGLKNCIITPHQAWASQSARSKLLNETALNIQSFLEGTVRNQVNP